MVSFISQSCQEDDFGVVDRETLIEQGMYLTARNGEAVAVSEDVDKAKWFEVGTPYRLLAFSKAYDKDNTADATPAGHPRFNKVAWEDKTGNDLHYINIDSAPDEWFGFSALNGETKGSDGLVSLDFYGFTYGVAAEHSPDYIELDGLTGETTPAAESLPTLKRTEAVNNGELKDLLRGALYNQNITTAGQDATEAMQSVLQFRHSFSLLQFMVVQQAEEDTEDTPVFPGISVTDIKVTNTYNEGAVYLMDGKVELDDKDKSTRQLKLTYTEPVITTQASIGQMIVFPSDGSALKSELPDGGGYDVGLEITVKCPDEATRQKFINKNPAETIRIEDRDDGPYLTIIKQHLINSYTNKILRFKQNTTYNLTISFQKDAVRIITVIPMVEEWILGEGNADYPWQNQELGQPQMFDNIVWSDRNLGADHYDPLIDFNGTVGYFYQSGRNIPYYPFNTDLYANDDRDKNKPADQVITAIPGVDEMKNSILADVTSYETSRFKLYPIVDERLLIMLRQKSGYGTPGSKGNDKTWVIAKGESAQIRIPEKKPTDGHYFDFKRGEPWEGLTEDEDMHWEEGPQNQPIAGSWIIPTSDDFMSIFPTTPFAGNITFRTGGNSSTPTDWGAGGNNEISSDFKTLRVTVPYHEYGMKSPKRTDSSKYTEAWNRLFDNHDEGSNNKNAYTNGSPESNVSSEPDGDPEAGYASVYVISRNDDSTTKLPASLQNDSRFMIKSWGTIYAIKRIYTSGAYRMRWRVLYQEKLLGTNKNTPGLYVEVCRYRCTEKDRLTEDNYMTYDWDHPAARIYFPICGLGDWPGVYINFGTECQYATRDPIVNGKTGAVHMKITGHDGYNAYIAVIKNVINRNFGKQIRPVLSGGVFH